MAVTRTRRILNAPLAIGTLIAVVAAIATCAQTPARLTTTIEWAGRGVWVKSDFHIQTKFSDGSHTIDELADAAVKNGCRAIAITDHGDGGLRAATPEYVDAIRAARARLPELTILTGLEWNPPPGKGQEHATVLFPTEMEALETVRSFKELYDDEDKKGENPELALKGLAALTPADRTAVAPVMFFNHPSRRPRSTSLPAQTFAALKKAAPGVVIGFEGGPGHQHASPLAAYPDQSLLVDRWDTVAATVDGAWDAWLRQGLNVWGAIADSDFHNEREDYWPCEFAATWLYAPDTTPNGIIRALHAGSFFAEHGHIVTTVELQARMDGPPRPAGVGEVLTAAAGAKASVTLTMTVPPKDFAGRDNRIDTVELIGISSTKTEVLYSASPASPDAFNVPVTIPPGGIVVRARGRRTIEGEPALMLYTNPIRISAAAR
jgi:hypothetical protein